MIDLDYQDREDFHEFKRIVEKIDAQAELYDETEDWSLKERDEGPVSMDIIRYVLEPQEYFLKLWNRTHDSIKDDCEKRSTLKQYRELQDTLYERQDFVENVYQLQKPLGKAKVEARYPW